MLIIHMYMYMFVFIIVAILDQIIVSTRQTWCYRYDDNNIIDGEAVPKYQIRTKRRGEPAGHPLSTTTT